MATASSLGLVETKNEDLELYNELIEEGKVIAAELFRLTRELIEISKTKELRALHADKIKELSDERAECDTRQTETLKLIQSMAVSLKLLGSPAHGLLTAPAATPVVTSTTVTSPATKSHDRWVIPSFTDAEKFNPSTTNVSDFVKMLRARLCASNVPDCEKYRVFGAALTGQPQRWALEHILDLKLDWDQAVSAFTAEFTAQTYAYACAIKMLELKQGDRLGADFLREVEELAKGADLSLDESFFKLHLRERQLNPRYLQALVNSMGKKLRDAPFEELKQQVLFLDTTPLAKSNHGKHSDRKKDPPKDSDKDKPRRTPYNPDAWCNHCNRSGHDTANHLFPKKPKGESKSTSSNQATRDEAKMANVTCSRCQERGHYANKCPQSSNSHSSSSKSNPSSTTRSIDLGRAAQRIAAMRARDAKEGSEVGVTQAQLEEISEDDIFESIYELHNRRYPQ